MFENEKSRCQKHAIDDLTRPWQRLGELNWLINGISRLINGINRLSNGINRLTRVINRLINGWGAVGARPGPPGH